MYVKLIAAAATAVVGAATVIGKKIHDKKHKQKNYDMNGYDEKGYDVNSKNRDYYQHEIKEMRSLLSEAHNTMQSGRFDLTLNKIRTGSAKGIKCILLHWSAEHTLDELNSNTLSDNINLCEKNCIFTDEFTRKLYEVKRYCGNNESERCTNIQNNQVYFCYKTFEELIVCIEQFAENGG